MISNIPLNNNPLINNTQLRTTNKILRSISMEARFPPHKRRLLVQSTPLTITSPKNPPFYQFRRRRRLPPSQKTAQRRSFINGGVGGGYFYGGRLFTKHKHILMHRSSRARQMYAWIYIYIYIYIERERDLCMYTCVYIYIYIYIYNMKCLMLSEAARPLSCAWRSAPTTTAPSTAWPGAESAPRESCLGAGSEFGQSISR